MTNKEIIKALRLTASLLELYGENQFKIRSYQTAVYNLEREEVDLTVLSEVELAELSGVGKSIAKIINELNTTEASSALNNLLKQTPSGVQELLQIKGLGAKKIKTMWDELSIEDPQQALNAAKRGALADLPGFGSKTQEKILQILEYHQETKRYKHYKDAHLQGLWLEQQLGPSATELTRVGAFRRKQDVIERIEYLYPTNEPWVLEQMIDQLNGLVKDHQQSGPWRWQGRFEESGLPLDIRFCKPQQFGSKLVLLTGSADHLRLSTTQGVQMGRWVRDRDQNEEELYESAGWPYVPPELREGLFEERMIKEGSIPPLLQFDQLKGVLHNHSTYSDGKNSLRDMALQCQKLGYQYFGISDHSQTAVYANGLDAEQVFKQHDEIDQLNEELAPFRIFKGIESDILNDGALDYPTEVLQSFDFVVASIHFNLNMDKKKATDRLVKAVENPFTTMLGHPTGRQLLKREGYPIDHQKVIDACAANGVVIEINAHPWRLDLAWEWVNYALHKDVKISINPDAHSKEGLKDMYYGWCVGLKAGLTAAHTFNALAVDEVEAYFQARKQKAVTQV